jgi:HAE1 family hydrophobic/amphiphilic exporter-1
MFYIGVVLLGLIAVTNLSVDFLPSIKIPKLTVQTSYPNTSPEEVEQAVTQPIEAALGTVVGAKRVSSVTREGQSVVTVEFYWGTNMDFALLEVREKLDQMRGALPREASRPTILRVDPSTEPIMTVALSSQDKEEKGSVRLVEVKRVGENGRVGDRGRWLVELKETARALVKRRIEQIDGVAQASVLGGVEREIHVDVDSRKMQSLGITTEQVAQALANANLNLPGGSIKRGLFRYSLRTLGEFTAVEEIRNVVVMKTSSGRLVRVSDIAEVVDTHKERVGITRYNGQEIIALQIRKEAGTNTVEVSRKLHEVLAHLRAEYPNLHLVVLSDQAEFIGRSISDVQQAIVIGALLAFVVLFFFLRDLRSPLIIGLTMPVSILATFIVMYFLNVNLNIISLTGLALGIGMLGDNAIILVENVTRLREQGKSLREATLEGAKDINVAVTASTLTNVAIFLPIIFVEGVASKLFVDMGVTMTVSLLVSLFVAVTLVPMLVSREGFFGKRGQQRQSPESSRFPSADTSISPEDSEAALKPFFAIARDSFYAFTERVKTASHAALDKYLALGLQHRGKVVFATLGMFLLSVVGALFIRSEPAPDIDQSRFTIQIMLPKGTSLEGVSTFVGYVESRLREVHDVVGVYCSIGITDETNIWTASDAAIERAVVEVTVREGASTKEVLEHARRIVAGLQATTSGVEFAVRSRGTTFENILRPEENDIKMRVVGKDPNVIAQIADNFLASVKTVRGLVDVRQSLQRGTLEYRITVDRDQAMRYGFTVQSVAEHIKQHVQGIEATTLSDFDRKITIRVQPTDEARKDTDPKRSSGWADILDSEVGGEGVPLHTLVHWEQTMGIGEIWRENHQRAMVITANVTGRSLASIVEELQDRANGMRLPAGYAITIGGENEEIRESFRSLMLVILLSIFLVFMILAAEYESVLYPLVILLTSPLAFIGAILAMMVTNQAYNVMSLIGLVIMIGAVDNDAVIVVDVITSLRRKGVALYDAIREGMQQRLRPILMTTATTVLGIIPLFFEFGTGSELVRALTVPIVGGLVASTFFTVVAIPIVYTFIDTWAMSGRSMPESSRM